MGELLTSLDVVNQSFKKCMRGYDPVEVDEFLDQVAATLQNYVQKIKDMIKIKVDFIVMVKRFLMMTIILIIEIYKWMLEVLPLMDIVWI